MIQDNVLTQHMATSTQRTFPEDGSSVDGDEIVRVLQRAADDIHFIAELSDNGSEALQDYDLTWQARAALLSGDIRWIEAHLGRRLDARLRTWLDCRLQQERW